MMIAARIKLVDEQRPELWDESWGIKLPLDHVICRDIDGTPHTVGELSWPWSAYTKDRRNLILHFYYWNQQTGPKITNDIAVSPARLSRIRELQFLMTRQIYYGNEVSPVTLQSKLHTLNSLARFAEDHSCTVKAVLTNTSLLDAFGAVIPPSHIANWMAWIKLFRKLDSVTELGFTLAKQKQAKDLVRRLKEYTDNNRQYAPLPTRIYGQLINNLAAEMDDIELHAPNLLQALEDALIEYSKGNRSSSDHSLTIGPALIEKYGLGEYLTRRGFHLVNRALASLSGAITEIFLVCKLQIHVFSGMRHAEALDLPYHCMLTQKGLHGRSHSVIAGVTTKFNKGRRLRTHWVTTNEEGFRAIRLAQRFAGVIYKSIGVRPSKADAKKDAYPLFLTTDYLPWLNGKGESETRLCSAELKLATAKEALHARLSSIIEQCDIVELEQIDLFRTWRDEPEFCVGQLWRLSTHQLRRSLAMYANASGLVSLSSLRRQLQHITREMSLYYARGSTFCKNFIADDPDGYMKHVALEWQNGDDEARMLAFTRDVLNSNEPMFGGAGNFYQRQKQRGDVMSRKEVETQMRAGLLSYTPSPFGGCTKTGGCDKRKALSLIDISCAADNCRNLVGKHSKIIRVIQLKIAAMANANPNSIETDIEKDDLEALKRIERAWRPHSRDVDHQGSKHG